MAHFENNEYYRVSGLELPIRVGKEVTLFLWGGDFDGSDLDVKPSDENVLDIKEDKNGINRPNYRKFKVTAKQDADTVQVFVRPKTAPSNVNWDMVNFFVLTKSERAGSHYRDSVISIARSHIGAHYLWGAAGAMPDLGGGMPSRRGFVSLLKTPVQNGDLINSTAICEVAGKCTCAGNPWIIANQNDPPYIQDISKANFSLEDKNHTYRTVHKPYAAVKKPGIILGEKCEGKHHFDCIGFVNYCLSLALGKVVHGDIAGYANYREVADNQRLPGDIIIYQNYHHISFYLNSGQVINAAETEYGVKISPLSAANPERTDGGPIKTVRHPDLFD